jgi:argonaute-like protein implicated in RNA metabolism and viral defense
VIPLPVRAAGEKVQIEYIFSQLYGKLGSQLENKKLLILRDGRATKEEKEQLPQVSKNINFKFSLVNVIKHHNTRFKDNKYNFIKEDEIYVTYALTRLDLARIYGEGNSLRLPAPIYYADRLVKMLDKGIYFYSDDEINQHFLFFI